MLRKAIPVSIVVILAACVAALSGAVSAKGGVSFTVDDTADALDASPGDGSCATAGGSCTLRAAIMETNALDGADTVILPSGTYTLTIGARPRICAPWATWTSPTT
jgi:CSLREA domain-containing protein